MAVELGLGLLSIGRTWGVKKIPPPPKHEALQLLSTACANGIRFFDTAPAYGGSERLLGDFLVRHPDARAGMIVATKFGEFWDAASEISRIAHDLGSLTASLKQSLEFLQKIDLIQLHKATPDNVLSRDVRAALDLAGELGVPWTGASVSDPETARLACESGLYHYLQFPFNARNPQFLDVFHLCASNGVRAVVNRPLAMGALLDKGEPADALKASFGHILRQNFDGVVLTGTSSSVHVLQSIKAFRAITS